MNLNNITTALKTGITIYQYEQWQNTGSVNLMQKESHMLSKVWYKTNIYNPDSLDKPFIQLSATFTSEFDIQEYNEWLRANQYKLYPLLLDILEISLKDDQYYDYSPSQVEAILFGILQLTPEHQDIIVIDLKKHLKSFIQDKDQAEEMITQYTCYYNAIKRWESNHKETEILHQLEISNLLEQLKNN